MRTDTVAFATKNVALAKRPRYVIELAFDSANTILWYFTSHTDSALPGGASAILEVIEGLSSTSQTLNPDTANATIGNINFQLVDRGSIITTTLGGELVLGRSTRRQRVREYFGYEGLPWADYTLVQTQLLTEISNHDGADKFTCADIQREMRKDIFELAKTTLSATVAASELTAACLVGAATLSVANASNFPASGSGIIRENTANDNDVFTWTGKTATTLTGCSGVLAHGIGAIVGDAVINVVSTAAFSMVAHGTSYSDAPSAMVGYVKLQDEVVRYTGKTSTQFTGCTRGALNTRAVEHPVDLSAAEDRRTPVEEYVYLEMPAVKLIYALLTGILHGQGGATLPTKWHLGIPTSYVRLSDFTGIGMDLWDTADDEQGLVVRGEGLEKTDGKKFIETELALLAGVFMPVYADGALGLRRMANILSGAAYSKMLDNSNIVSIDPLVHDFNALHNVLQISWNWEVARKEFTRVNLLIDAASITIHGRSDPLKLKFRLLHGSRHSQTTIAQLFDALRDRYTGPPERLSLTVLPSLNTIEVGDIVRVRTAGVRDFVTPEGGGDLDRSFEVQNVSNDWVTGNVTLKLFGSSQAPGAIAATADATVLSDAWWTSQGTLLVTGVGGITITGSNPGHVTVGGTLTGTADMNAAGSIFYYVGDLIIDPGVTINVVNNVQLRIKGVFTNNGRINGVGNGLAGAAAVVGATTAQQYNSGTAGFIGNTEAGGGIHIFVNRLTPPPIFVNVEAFSFRGGQIVAANSAIPGFNLNWNGTLLSGLPAELRGSSGSSGMPASYGLPKGDGSMPSDVANIFEGGTGGNGGAGLIFVSRGFAQGVAGVIDLSGADGGLGQTISNSALLVHAGSGAGGAPGGLLVILDGAGASATGLNDAGFVTEYGTTPVRNNILESPVTVVPDEEDEVYSYFVGTGDGTTFDLPGTLPGSNLAFQRVQYVPGTGTVEADAPADTLIAPTNLGLASGTAELLLQNDGTVVPRIKVTWTPSVDARTAGYDIQSKPSSESIWTSIAPVIGQSANTAWIQVVRDGVNYDVRIRSAGRTREVSDWLTITDFLVIGKTALPANVTGFSASQNGNVVVLQWDQVADVDLAGYEIRYGLSGVTWENAIPLTKVTRGTNITSAAVPPGAWKLMIKARDTSGNYSATEASTLLTVVSTLDVIYQRQQAPDWLGTLIDFVKSWDGVLVPESTMNADDETNAELFEQWVPYPVAQAIYEAPEIDIGFDDTARIWGSIDSALGPGVVAGIADPGLEVDFRTAAGSYDGFEPWTIGDRTGRFFKHRLVLDTAEGKAKILGFLPTVDQFERTERLQVVIAGGGSVVIFLDPFHSVPQVGALVVGSSALFVVVSSVTATQATFNVYNTSGTSVGGTINYDATGV